MMNWVDAILVAIIVAAVVIGFFQGLVRQIIALVALYVGLALGAQYYPLLADRVFTRSAAPPAVATEVLSFLGIFAAATIVVSVLGVGALRGSHLPTGLLVVDQFGGAMLGVGVGLALIATLSFALGYASDVATAGWSVMDFMRGETRDSSLIPFMLRSTHWVGRILAPWLPSGLPALLDH